MLTLLILISLTQVELNPAPRPDATNFYEVTNIKVIDGDTFEGDINFALGVSLINQRIRASDYDAWEMSKRRRTVLVTDKEVELGIAAKKAIEEKISHSYIDIYIYIKKGQERDVYGRVLGELIFVDNRKTVLDVPLGIEVFRPRQTFLFKEFMEEGGHIRQD